MGNVHSIDVEEDQFAYRYDTQLLIDRRDEDLDEDEIAEYISEHFEGNCLIAVGDEDLIKIHFHTNEPWKILEYCNSIGEIYDIVVEDMIRQSAALLSVAALKVSTLPSTDTSSPSTLYSGLNSSGSCTLIVVLPAVMLSLIHI